MSAHFTTPTDELLLLAETLGEVKTKADKLEAEFATQARPLEAATNALSAALSGIKALQFHVLDNNLGQLSARVEEMRKAVDEQVGVIALELKKADETNAAKAGQEAEALRSEIAALQAQLGTLGAQFSAQLERVEFSAKEEAKKLQLIPGPAGAAGASLNPRGTFIDGEIYNRLDVVSWLGSSYIAAVDGVTEKPSKNSNQWQVLASRGGGAAGGAGDFGSLAGVAQINQGGTGQTTRAAGLNALLPDQAGATQYMLLTDGAGNVSWGAQPVAGLPSQTGNSGKLLTTNGTSASWSNAVTVSGSNATVTGTLSSGGNLSVTGTSAQIILGQDSASQLTYLVRPKQAGGAIQFVQDSATINRWLSLGGADNTGVYSELLRVAGATNNILITSTNASTTTSTGALVVGNGTSGGLGVGGAINAGGAITSNNGSGSGLLGMRSSSGNASYVFWSETGVADRGILGFNNGSSTLSYRSGASSFSTGTEVFSISSGGNVVISGSGGYAVIGGRQWSFRANSSGGSPASGCVIRDDSAAADRLTIDINGNTSVLATTASTSTSSGALVVSGGVGVAKRIHSGEGLTTGGDNETQISFVRNGTISIGPTSAATPKLAVGGGLQLSNTSQSISAWGDVGAQLSVAGAVLTDTSSSGTVGRIVTNSIAASALAASSTTTYTAAASLFIAGAPTANTNVTITNAYALYTAGGRINFQGLPTSSAGLQAGTLWNDAGTLKVA